jgi:hypothetical protein
MTYRIEKRIGMTEQGATMPDQANTGRVPEADIGQPAIPAVVDRAEFAAQLAALRVREKAHTREGDAIAGAGRRLQRSRRRGDGHRQLVAGPDRLLTSGELGGLTRGVATQAAAHRGAARLPGPRKADLPVVAHPSRTLRRPRKRRLVMLRAEGARRRIRAAASDD